MVDIPSLQDGGTDTEPQTEQTEAEWSVILDAPDITTFIKKSKTGVAREYETKVQSMLKAGLQVRLTAPEGRGLPDVAAILSYGPDFALRAGELADHDERARKALDMITAPDNPWFLFAITALPFAAQLFRNHEDQVKSVPQNIKARRKMTKEERKAQPRAEVTLPLIRKKIRLPIRLRLSLGFLRSQTVDPRFLTHHVFEDEKICNALHKAYGVRISVNGADPRA